MRDSGAELDADPIREPIAERRPDRAGNPDRPEIELTGADQRADADKSRPGGYDELYQTQRLANGERKHDRGRPRLVYAHELDQLLRVPFDAFKHSE
jgi:hypothetical protein